MSFLSKGIKTEFFDIYRFRWVVISTVSNNMKIRYKRSVLGFFWSFLGPLISYGTIAVVFYYGLKIQMNNYFSYFFPGAIFYTFLSSSINQSAAALITNESYIKKIYLPKSIFILNSVLTESLVFFFNITAIVFLGIIMGKISIVPNMIFLPLAFIVGLVFVSGVGLIASILAVFLRDLLQVLPLLLQAMFYITPILYDSKSMPEHLQRLIWLNPFSYFTSLVQACFSIDPFQWSYFVYPIIISMVFFVFGVVTIKFFEDSVIYEL